MGILTSILLGCMLKVPKETQMDKNQLENKLTKNEQTFITKLLEIIKIGPYELWIGLFWVTLNCLDQVLLTLKQVGDNWFFY